MTPHSSISPSSQYKYSLLHFSHGTSVAKPSFALNLRLVPQSPFLAIFTLSSHPQVILFLKHLLSIHLKSHQHYLYSSHIPNIVHHNHMTFSSPFDQVMFWSSKFFVPSPRQALDNWMQFLEYIPKELFWKTFFLHFFWIMWQWTPMASTARAQATNNDCLPSNFLCSYHNHKTTCSECIYMRIILGDIFPVLLK